MTENEVPKAPPERMSLSADRTAKPVVLRDVMEEMGLIGPHVPAEDLKGQTFEIYRAKPFASSYEPGKRCYFCHCLDRETGEIFSTVLGGQAVVELIDDYIEHGPGDPIVVTLQFAEGAGAHDGYYYLE